MNDDLVELVRSALRKNGCDERLLNNFDGNSTICLDFEEESSLLISQTEGYVVLWTQLQPHDPYILSQCASALLALVMAPCFHAVTGHLQLSENEGMTTLECYVKPASLNAEDFSEALEEFYRQMKAFREALR